MALHWEWKDKMGEVIYEDGHKDNLYKGNAYMIAVYESGNEYQLTWFASGKDHMRNMLGLTKDYKGENVVEHWGIRAIRLNTRYKDVPTIVSDFAKAKMKLNVELYYAEWGEEESE